MILTAHQPAYLPWLGFFHKIAISDVYIILDDVQFQKNYFTNRNKIKTMQGEAWLTVPIYTTGHINKTIAEMEIVDASNWRKKHFKSIEIHYKKAPYFNEYSDYFKKLYEKEWKNLFDLLYETMLFFFRELKIETKIYLQSKYGFKEKKQDLILEMCNCFNSDLFVFGRDGANYADTEYFKTHKRKIYFQEYKHPIYPQLNGNFIPNLSIIDLLFNVGKDKSLEYIMKDNISKIELNKIIEINRKD